MLSERDKFIRRLRKDPVFFCTDILGFEPTEYQKDILRALVDNDTVVVQSCNSIGKTRLSAAALLWFMYSFVPALGYTTAPTDRQVRRVLWREIGILFNSAKVKLDGTLYKVPYLVIDEKSGHYAHGFSTDKPDNAMGLHEKHLIAIHEEASGITSEMNAATMGNLSGGFTRWLNIGNPLDRASDFYVLAHRPHVKKFKISAYDTPNFTTYGITEKDILAGRSHWDAKITGPMPWPALVQPRFAADMYETYGRDSVEYVARVLGEFPSSNDDALIPYSAIEAAVQRWKHYQDAVREGDPSEAPIRPEGMCKQGIDVADEGKDHTVRTIVYESGYVLPPFDAPYDNTNETQGHAVREAGEYGFSSIKVDKVGIGHAVWRGLQERLDDILVLGCNAGGKPMNRERFKDQEAEAAWNLRERFVTGRIAIPNHPKLVEELTNIKRITLSNGQMDLEPKSSLKKRIKRSPDFFESLMWAFYEGHDDEEETYVATAETDRELFDEPDEIDEEEMYGVVLDEEDAAIRQRTLTHLFGYSKFA